MEEKIVHTQTVAITLKPSGIAEFRAKPEMKREFNEADMIEIDELAQTFKDTHRLFLVFIVNGKYSQAARNHLAKQETVADKIAMVATGPLQILVGNFFLGLNRPKISIKLFKTAKKAEKWLLSS